MRTPNKQEAILIQFHEGMLFLSEFSNKLIKAMSFIPKPIKKIKTGGLVKSYKENKKGNMIIPREIVENIAKNINKTRKINIKINNKELNKYTLKKMKRKLKHE